MNLVILRDNNEQAPLCPFRWRIDDGIARREPIATRDVSLVTGDYSLPGLEHLITIERKSLPDLWGTLFGRVPNNSLGEAQRAQDRFRRELDRMRGHARTWLVIEGDVGSFAGAGEHTLVTYAERRYNSPQNRRRGRTPQENVLSVRSLLSAFEVDYGIGVVWAGSRAGAEWWIGKTLSRIWNEATGGDKARTVEARGLDRAAVPWLRLLESREETAA